MNETLLEKDTIRVCDLAKSKMRENARSIIGIVGPPASGKSTLADSMLRLLNKGSESPVPIASLLPMDGYHLDNRLLESRGLLARKGAPETFDAHGFCEAVRRLLTATRESYHPRFDRKMDLAIANAIAIHPETPLIIVEGNYLLLKTEPWTSLRQVFAASVFVSPSIETLRDRLQQRWIENGLDPEAATLRATNNDLVNARLVIDNSHRADLTLS